MGEVSCADAFAPKSGEGDGGSEGVGGLSFPMKPMSLFAVAAYVYDCAGGATPSGANENGETTCQCPAAMVYVDGECVEATAENKCKAAGWSVTVQFGSLKFCEGPSFANGIVGTFPGTRFTDNCISVDNPRPGDDGCHLFVGADLNFPVRPADGNVPHYAINCGTASGGTPANNGLIPASTANGATNCYCEDSTATHFGATVTDNGGGVTLRYGGVCLSGESARAAAACEGAGWSLTSDSKGWQCAIPVMRGTLSAGSSEGCYLSGVATVALPQCSEVFGGSFAFPEKPTGTAPRYVFDCGTKMTPEGANLDGATICECAATNAQGECICGGGRVERPNPEGGTHCVCIRGTAEVGGVCVNREGPIGGVSEGLAAQVTLCRAFGGEVLSDRGTVIEDGTSLSVLSSLQLKALESIREFTTGNAAVDSALENALFSWLSGDENFYATNNIADVDGALFGLAIEEAYGEGVDRDVYVFGQCDGLRSSTDNEPYLLCMLEQLPQVVVEAGVACRGVDKSGTFCLLGSLEVFPCRGLFTRARDCNIKYNRPLLNPFLCAPSCPPASPPAAPSANNPAPKAPPQNRVVPKLCLGMRPAKRRLAI